MSYYAEPIIPSAYKYVRAIMITEPGLCDRPDAHIFLSLTKDNFNFQLLDSDGKDIRFAESYTGADALCYWITRYDLSIQSLNVWIRIPNFKKDSTRVIYMFWGRENDPGSSDVDSMGFYFATDLKKKVINYSKLSSSGNLSFNSNGLRFSTDTVITTKGSVLLGKTKWVVDIDTYWDFVQNIQGQSNFRIIILGDENAFTSYFFQSNKVNTNAQILATYKNYYFSNGPSINTYNRMLLGYREEMDYVYYEYRNRIGVDDSKLSVERRVEGDTRPTDLRIAGYSYRGFYYTYVGNIVIREFYEKEFIIDTSNLYIPNAYIIYDVIDFDKYGPNLVNEGYAHFSYPAGNPYKLSDSLTGGLDTYYEVELDNGKAEVIIDFGRNANDLVGDSIGLYPYEYIADSGLTFLEVSEFSDMYDSRGLRYWQAPDEQGWICIEFPPPGRLVNVFSFMGEGIDHMPEDFLFQAGFISPFRAKEYDWFTMVSGTCTRSDDWHTYYFNNYNVFPYYRLLVKSTFGGEPHRVRRWQMFKRERFFRPRTVCKLRLLPSKHSSNDKYYPKRISIYGSNDFNLWEPLLVDYDTAAPYFEYYGSYWQDIKFVNESAYWAYKLVVEDNWAGTDDKVIIDEWEMYESYYEINTERVLSGNSDDSSGIWASSDANIDKGWIYITNDRLNYIFEGKFVTSKDIGTNVIDVQDTRSNN